MARSYVGLLPGDRIGDYRVAGSPLRGGFASVFRCESVKDGSTVAIKVLDELQLNASHALTRFEQEVEAIRRIDHPNIVKQFGYGLLPDGRPYYIMEWLDGVPLRQELYNRGPLLPSEALPIVEQLGAALAAAHAVGVVHRDLKPDNIMVVPSSEGPSVKLLDFGISKLIGRGDARSRLTTTGICLGTVHYMAPEQILCDEIDIRTDIYALGILLFRMVTGALPFHASEPANVQMMHLDQPAPRASTRAPAAAVWDRVIHQCLAKRPSQRPESVAQVLSMLRSSLAESNSSLDRIVIQVEFHGSGDASWTTRDMVLDMVASVIQLAGWTIIVEAGDGIIAQSERPAKSREASRWWSGVIDTAHRLVTAASIPPIVPQVWIRPVDAPAPPPSSSGPVNPGVFVSPQLLAAAPPPSS
ncbi:serine/threonine protein kinase [Haliangium ochraceum DSM 14365]|uniref:Serine/threonine protein kinase n=2 Tax=Haliangium ochraceum TaxID=80816 RepID=D0LHC3_HALO1|nr:serine/threonine protein kinase [Haliangium ochraceum DSM 14365]